MSILTYLIEKAKECGCNYVVNRVQHGRVPMFIEITGTGEVTGEVLRAIKSHTFTYKDELGMEQENATIEVAGKGQVKEELTNSGIRPVKDMGTVLSLRVPVNSEDVVVREMNKCLKQFKLSAKKLTTIKNISFVNIG